MCSSISVRCEKFAFRVSACARSWKRKKWLSWSDHSGTHERSFSHAEGLKTHAVMHEAAVPRVAVCGCRARFARESVDKGRRKENGISAIPPLRMEVEARVVILRRADDSPPISRTRVLARVPVGPLGRNVAEGRVDALPIDVARCR